jgi:hypothetical protein
MKFFRISRILTLLLIAYFLLPIAIRALSEYDMNNIILGESPAFSIKSEDYNKNGDIYYGLLYRIISVKKVIKKDEAIQNTMIIGPILNYHSILDFLYFWTGEFFSEVQSLKRVSTRKKGPITI